MAGGPTIGGSLEFPLTKVSTGEFWSYQEDQSESHSPLLGGS